MIIINQPSLRLIIYRQFPIPQYCKISSFSRQTSFSRLNPCKTLKQIKAYTTASTLSSAEEDNKRGFNGDGGESFYAGESVSWSSLGVSDQLSRSLSSIGLTKPSMIQASCMPTILSGKDVIVAAETGSGKTHGYLVPLIDKMCNSPGHSSVTDDDRDYVRPYQFSLVLCPNVMLCEQVARMANCDH